MLLEELKMWYNEYSEIYIKMWYNEYSEIYNVSNLGLNVEFHAAYIGMTIYGVIRKSCSSPKLFTSPALRLSLQLVMCWDTGDTHKQQGFDFELPLDAVQSGKFSCCQPFVMFLQSHNYSF